MDNFEHLEEAWPVVLDMLTAAPDLRILATRRRPLGLRAEYEYKLAPLALPPLDPPLPPHVLQEVPAVKLFLTRGRAVRPHLNLHSNNAAAMTRLCRRLDGLPLAIKLAAAQLRRRTEHELLDDLEVSLAALPAAFRDLPDRQRTLTAMIAWSYRLLGEAERQLFDQLGVFAADPTVAAVSSIRGSAPGAEAVAEDVLTALARHSLLRRYTDTAGESRVSMLQSVREFARDRLRSRGDAATVQRRHAEYYLNLAEAVSPQLWGPDQVDAFRILHAEAPDLRSALLWATGPDGSTDLALRLVGQLWHYWELTEEAAELHRQALQAFQNAGNDQGVAWTTMCLAAQAMELNDADAARRLAAEALNLPHASARTRAAAMTVMERLAFYAGDHVRAHRLSRQIRSSPPYNFRLTVRASTSQAGEYPVGTVSARGKCKDSVCMLGQAL